MTIAILAAGGFIAWLLSTLAGGGAAMLMIPIVTWLVGARAVPPVITISNLFGGSARLYLFWKDINWQIVRWYLPGAVVGAAIGAYLFATIEIRWLQIVLGLLLISTAFQFRFGEARRTLNVRDWHFLPIGFGVALLSGLAGATGEVLTPFYLNYGSVKEEMVATKSLNSLVMQLVKLSTYLALGAVAAEHLVYAVTIGIAAVLASWVGKRLLGRMETKWFRRLALAIMAASGVALIWERRDIWLAWLS